ncbi:hypothetical protein ABPG75_004926 [Micractinium tetrahymenae]
MQAGQTAAACSRPSAAAHHRPLVVPDGIPAAPSLFTFHPLDPPTRVPPKPAVAAKPTAHCAIPLPPVCPAAALLVQQRALGFAPVALIPLPCGLEGEPEVLELALQAARAWAAPRCPGWGVLELGRSQRFEVRPGLLGGGSVGTHPWGTRPAALHSTLALLSCCSWWHTAPTLPTAAIASH